MTTEWAARWPDGLRTTLLLATGLPALGLALAGMVGPVFVDVEGLPNLILVGGLWLFVAPVIRNRRTYRATDEGLEREGRFVTRSYAWADFEGYAVRDGTLVIERSATLWPSVRCATADIEDLDAVLAALDAHLDRL